MITGWKVLREHDTLDGDTFHENVLLYTHGVVRGDARFSAPSRGPVGSPGKFRWHLLTCNNIDCNFEAWVRTDILMSLVNKYINEFGR